VSPGSAAALPGVDGFTSRYADLIVRVGANVQPGQVVVVLAAPEHAPLARAILAAAWAAGAADGQIVYIDEIESLLRVEHAADEVLDRAPVSRQGTYEWLLEAQGVEIFLDGDVFPDRWALVDGGRAARVHRPRSTVTVRRRLINEGRMAWTYVGVPTGAWATKVFGEPDLERLQAAIAEAVRLDLPDPVEAWRTHLARLAERCGQLSERRFDAIRFRGPGTDLTVGLLEGHRWMGGASTTRWGQQHCVNLPTEEVFTTPDRRRTEGRVRTTRPVSYGGVLLDAVELVFEAGRGRLVGAASGAEYVAGELERDEGAAYLGEVALVDGDSPVGRSGLLYHSPLFDENVTSHIAYGGAYTAPIPGTDDLPPDELVPRGINDSGVHTDLPIGGDEIEVVGLAADGTETAILAGVDWVLD
jgi:aminopeptidase